MPRPTCLMRVPLLALALVSVPSCSNAPAPRVALALPADTFARADRPEMTALALESEAEAERVQDARDAWGKAVARQLDAACRLIQRTAVPSLICRGERAEWEAPE